MKKFTFVSFYKQGMDVTQYIAQDILEAISLWVKGLNETFYEQKDKTEIVERACKGELIPISVKGVESVWRIHFATSQHSLFLEIVETVL